MCQRYLEERLCLKDGNLTCKIFHCVFCLRSYQVLIRFIMTIQSILYEQTKHTMSRNCHLDLTTRNSLFTGLSVSWILIRKIVFLWRFFKAFIILQDESYLLCLIYFVVHILLPLVCTCIVFWSAKWSHGLHFSPLYYESANY